MEMKKYLELGEEKAGKQIELAKILGIPDSYIRIVKSGRRGLPADVCIKLADYIGANRLEIIAASNLVTEKDEEKRKIFKSCFTRAASIAAAALIFAGSSITSSPVHAAMSENRSENILYYVKLKITILFIINKLNN